MASIRNNPQYDQIRDNLEARNLYNPENPYSINNNNLVKAVNSIAGLIPGKSIDITNTVIGRVFLSNQTPIMTIGLQQYSKHLAQSVTSYGISDAMPSANLMNLFDGDPNTKLLTKKEDYRITRDETKTTIGRIIQDITNQSPKLSNTVFTGRGNLAPFDKFPNQFDYIRNTGKGQLNQYYGSIGMNLYIQTSEDFITVAENQGYKIDKVTKPLLNKVFFPTDDYEGFPDGQAASDEVRSEIVWFREEQNEQRVSEYGSDIVKLAHGKSKRNERQEIAQNLPDQEQDIDVEIDDNTFGFASENLDDQIVWGRTDDFRRFGVRSGALLYTKGLLQARGSRAYFDQTKKKITHNGKLSYNGSPLTREIDGTTNRVRQHTIEDPYNTYAKAIRFNGNNLYSAPTESVIHKTVIPKLHPIVKSSSEIDRSNMMFSIENLAYILNDAGYLGDSLGTKVPKSEVGYNRGRLMWFAPYDVEVSETAAAKYETTQFIGRSEPIYSYQSSERTARLSFKLIVDYPPQVDGQSHSNNAKFFAFGGISPNQLKNVDIDKEKAKLVQLKNELAGIQPTTELLPPPDLITGKIASFYFNNDEDDIDTDLGLGYEDGIKSNDEKSDFGLNARFQDDIDNAVQILTNDTGNGKAFRYYKLRFVGRASRLYNNQNKEAAYNKALGERRATSLKNYLEDYFAADFGLDFDNTPIQYEIITIGSNSGSTVGSTVQGIPLEEVKKERSAWVEFLPSGFVDRKNVPLTTEQLNRKKVLEEEIRAKEELIALAAKAQNDERFFNEVKINDRAMRGFESMKKLTFSPVFHSQTPEDFHRRLTFLHQCTRQGNSVTNKSSSDAGVGSATNSVFGRPPICILRLGDMFHSKVIIETVDFDFSESIWDINPEGMGMQFMIADISLSMKIIGGQSLKAAIDVIQNAESFNYYANSTYFNNDVYQFARKVEDAQVKENITLTNAKGEARFGSNISGEAGGSFVPLPSTPAV